MEAGGYGDEADDLECPQILWRGETLLPKSPEALWCCASLKLDLLHSNILSRAPRARLRMIRSVGREVQDIGLTSAQIGVEYPSSQLVLFQDFKSANVALNARLTEPNVSRNSVALFAMDEAGPQTLCEL